MTVSNSHSSAKWWFLRTVRRALFGALPVDPECPKYPWFAHEQNGLTRIERKIKGLEGLINVLTTD